MRIARSLAQIIIHNVEAIKPWQRRDDRSQNAEMRAAFTSACSFRGGGVLYICICYESLLLSWYIEDGIGDGSMRAVEGSKLAREEGIFCIRVVVGDLNVRYLLCFIDCQG